jgi:hypothetical protein
MSVHHSASQEFETLLPLRRESRGLHGFFRRILAWVGL